MATVVRIAMFLGLAGLVLAAFGCGRQSVSDERCLACHAGLEAASPSHTGCIGCHGGNPAGRTKDDAHRGIYGLADASYAGRWERGCGGCHHHQVERVRSSQMYTNAGMIAQIQATWEGQRDSVIYASRDARLHDTAGLPLKHTCISTARSVIALARKLCMLCPRPDSRMWHSTHVCEPPSGT